MSKRTIEVDDATVAALESRAAEVGLSVPELLAELVAIEGASTKLPDAEITELDRQWAAIKAGEPTIAHDDVVRWLDTWGTPGFRAWDSPGDAQLPG
jgi:predicted transcriptional regulator